VLIRAAVTSRTVMSESDMSHVWSPRRDQHARPSRRRAPAAARERRCSPEAGIITRRSSSLGIRSTRSDRARRADRGRNGGPQPEMDVRFGARVTAILAPPKSPRSRPDRHSLNNAAATHPPASVRRISKTDGHRTRAEPMTESGGAAGRTTSRRCPSLAPDPAPPGRPVPSCGQSQGRRGRFRSPLRPGRPAASTA